MSFEPKGAQRKALERSNGRVGFGYFMEQGLGKTSTSYMDFLEHAAMGMVDRMVTISPNSFKGGWNDEAQKFSFPVTPLVFESGGTEDMLRRFRRGFDTRPNLIVNYEALRSQSTRDMVAEFLNGRRGYIVADESIKLKDHRSEQTKAALEVGKMGTMTRILSGKPMSQGPHDLWAQMRFIKQLNGFEYYPFKSAFCKMGGFKAKQVVGVMNEEILAERIDPHVFRATKAEWTDLPPKVYTTREYTMTPEMKSMYKSMEDEFVIWLNEAENVSVDAAITKYIKLAQIQAGFIIDSEGNTRILVDPARNPRLNALEDIIRDEIVGKVSVVYNHKVVRPMLYERFAKYNPTHISGGMTTEEIEANKRKFNNDPTCRIIFLTKAAKYGHTLLGGAEPVNHCSTQVFFENTYSLDDRSQIEDRSHRYGQLGDSMSYYDIVGTPLDRDATRALQRKEGVFQAVFAHIGKKI